MANNSLVQQWLDDQLSFEKEKDFHLWLEEQGYEVLLRGADGNEEPIEIARALFHSDRTIYSRLKSDYESDKRSRILRLVDFPDNEGRFDDLLWILKNQVTVFPFVGAGLSAAAGCPTWSAYIIEQACRAGFQEDEVRARLTAGEQEQVMDEVIASRTVEVFRRDFTSSFERIRLNPRLSPAKCFVGLFDGPAITTNFDRVLETCLSDEGHPFAEKVTGTEDSARFVRGAYRGERYLLKLHGNIDEVANRVLTKQEYDRAYGDNGLDYSKRLPKMMRQIFSSFSVIFLGCSLVADRYLDILHFLFREQEEYMPKHFAILEAPEGDDELRQRDIFLASCGVSPIWYSHGDYEAVTDILDLLRLEKGI